MTDFEYQDWSGERYLPSPLGRRDGDEGLARVRKRKRFAMPIQNTGGR